ncbi:MAG: hypothetical protein OXC62_09525, partial [Aestuariivita sp.]|nr:hypothetical protein [Aestuariivita sp.]
CFCWECGRLLPHHMRTTPGVSKVLLNSASFGATHVQHFENVFTPFEHRRRNSFGLSAKGVGAFVVHHGRCPLF